MIFLRDLEFHVNVFLCNHLLLVYAYSMLSGQAWKW